MNCPVCKRDLAPSLSICLTCGAMMNDSVREELETKIGRGSGPLSGPEINCSEPIPRSMGHAAAPTPKAAPPEPARLPKRTITAELPRKHTSPTLVEFQNRNATLPDWRLQIQNSVRQRVNGTGERSTGLNIERGSAETAYPTNGAAALKMEFVETPSTADPKSEKVANALKRIEASRRAFLPETSAASPKAASPAKNYPFNVVTRTAETPAPRQPVSRETLQSSPKPKLVSSLRIEKKPYDTNKLPPLPQPAKLHSSFDEQPTEAPIPKEILEERAEAFSRVVIEKTEPEAESLAEAIETPEIAEFEELDDLAPMSMRFGAGLFDAIIAGFSSLIILSPFMVGGGTWLSFYGALAFTATMFVFLFLYMTACLAFWGKTFGMRIFSLEMIDAEENVYPTVHQAAVSSAVFLMSLAFAGLGFITIFFNEERRAFHDIVSGTLLVREI
jgi:uncharacterized RDD family membrane protein YckC